jgi:hypothetical protein
LLPSKLALVYQDDDARDLSELDSYLDNPLVKNSSLDILEWWTTIGAQYPTIQRIVRNYNWAQSSSVASEELFSSGTDFVRGRQAPTFTETISQRMDLEYLKKQFLQYLY